MIPPKDVMEIEADLFIVFQGWDPNTTTNMLLPELMRWHRIAITRHQTAGKD